MKILDLVQNNTCLFQAPDKENKKIKKAKQLVEKAKVMQQSKRAATAEEKSAPRRSSRREATSRKSYCENEVSPHRFCQRLV